MSLIADAVHVYHCPGPSCRGQFFWVKHHGMICSVQLLKEMEWVGTWVPEVAAIELSRRANELQSEGLGLA